MEKPDLTCKVCNKQLTCLAILKNHMATHTGERNYVCQMCGKMYITNTSLQHHLKTHTGKKLQSKEKPFKCDKCHKSFFSAINLHRHISIGHTLLKCDFCKDMFLTKMEKIVHMRKHSDAFKCEPCYKTLDSRSELNDHQHTHQTETEFKCDKCQVYFNSEEILRSHMVRYNQHKHNCHKCGKKFLQEHKLRLHLQVHDKNIFSCYLCGESSMSVGSLKKHLKRHGEGEDSKLWINYGYSGENQDVSGIGGEDSNLTGGGSKGVNSQSDEDTSEEGSAEDFSGEENSGGTTENVMNDIKIVQNMPDDEDEDKKLGNSGTGDKGKNTGCVVVDEKNIEQDDEDNEEDSIGTLMYSFQDCAGNEKDVNEKVTIGLSKVQQSYETDQDVSLSSNEYSRETVIEKSGIDSSTHIQDSESVPVRSDADNNMASVNRPCDKELDINAGRDLRETDKIGPDKSTTKGFPSKISGWTVMEFGGDAFGENDCPVDISGIIGNLGDEDTSLPQNAVSQTNKMKEKSKQKTVRKLKTCPNKTTALLRGHKRLLHKHSKQKHHYQTRRKSRKCHICKRTFVSYAYLHYHLKTHKEQQPSKCKICLKTFCSKKVFKIHAYLHSKKKPLKCPECGKSFVFSSIFAAHKKRHWNEKLQHYVTEYEKLVKKEVEEIEPDIERENIVYFDTLSVKVELDTVDTANCFVCSKCYKTFSDVKELEAHRAVHALDEEVQSHFPNIDVETDQSQNSVQSKKKRGRPCIYPKNAKTIDNDTNNVTSLSSKKKRGRPLTCMKTSPVDARESSPEHMEVIQENGGCDDVSDFISQICSEAISSISVPGQRDFFAQDIEQFQVSISNKKKRGRPRKYPREPAIKEPLIKGWESVHDFEAVENGNFFSTINGMIYPIENYLSQDYVSDFQNYHSQTVERNKKKRGRPLKLRNSKIEARQVSEKRDETKWNWLEIIPIHTSCGVCGEEFSSRAELQIHVSNVHPKKKIFKCNECSQIFFSKCHLNLHAKSHKSLKDLACLVCKEKQSSRQAFKKHFRTHRNQKLYCCDVCYFYFKDIRALRMHEKSHEVKQQYSCSLCDMTCDSRELYKEHLLSHGKKGKRIAEEMNSDDSNGLSEVGTMKSSSIAKGKKKKNDLQQFQSTANRSGLSQAEISQSHCQHCGTLFRTKQELIEHVSSTHPEDYFSECSKCERVFFKKHHGLLHKEYHDKLVSFTCPVCETMNPSEERLEQHFASCTKCTETFFCNICCYYFLRKTNLEAHMLSHEQENGFACCECNRVYASYKSIQKHLATHRQDDEESEFEIYIDKADETVDVTETITTSPREGKEKKKSIGRPAKTWKRTLKKEVKLETQKLHDSEKGNDLLLCDVCPGKFNSRVKLTEHFEEVHDKKEYHSCSDCNKVFLKIYHMRMHKNYHDNIRTKKCLVCGKQFASDEKVGEHFDKHKKYLLYYCNICNHYTRDKTSLKAHMITHTGKKRFSCPECPKDYSDIRAIRNHLTKHPMSEKIEAFLGTIENKGPRPQRNPDQPGPAKKQIRKAFRSEESEEDGNFNKKKKKLSSWKQKDKNVSKLKEEPLNHTIRQSIRRSTQVDQLKYKEETAEDEEKDLIEEEMPRDEEISQEDEDMPQDEDTMDNDSEFDNEVLPNHDELTTAALQTTTKSKEASNEDLKQNDSQYTVQSFPETIHEDVPSTSELKDKSQLNEHQEKNSPEETFTCDTCGEIFHNKHLLNIHARSHSGIHPYKCSRCSATFLQHQPLADHVDQHQKEDNDNREEGASPDDETFMDGSVNESGSFGNSSDPTNEALSDSRDTGSEDLGVGSCTADADNPNHSVSQSEKYMKHFKEHDDKPDDWCQFCGKFFHDHQSFKEHFEFHLKMKPYECNICHKNFKTINTAKIHVRTDCGKLKSYKKQKPKGFPLRKESASHIEYSSGKFCGKCLICGKEFTDILLFDKHMQNIEGESKCRVCCESLDSKGKLMDHMKKHFQCEICHKAFDNKRSYINHKSSHTSVLSPKNTKCGICGRVLSSVFILRSHMKVHQNKRKYKCEFCNKAFVEKRHLKRHMLVHNKSVICKICGAAMRVKSDLKVHMRSHSEDRPFLCHLCSTGFKHEKALKQHIERHEYWDKRQSEETA